MTDEPAFRMACADWYATLPAPSLSAARDGLGHLDLRRYIGTPPRIEQPALTENLLCLHLGGAKRVRRWGAGRASTHDVELGALTILPAGQSNSWLTEGPVDFGLVAISPALLAQAAVEEFDREPASHELQDIVGFQHPGLNRLFQALLGSVGRSGPAGRLYPESLVVVLTVALLRDHSSLVGAGAPFVGAPQAGGLAPLRLRTVIDYMMDHMQDDIGLQDLTALTGLSRSQFFRAFKQSVGQAPYRYLAGLRLDKAKALLEGTSLGVAEVAAAVGLSPEYRFSGLFKQRFGVTPRHHRLSRR